MTRPDYVPSQMGATPSIPDCAVTHPDCPRCGESLSCRVCVAEINADPFRSGSAYDPDYSPDGLTCLDCGWPAR